MAWKQGSLRIFSRHPSHRVLRNVIEAEQNSVLRLGSTTEWEDAKIEINTVQAIKNCSDKILMKDLFWQNKVNSPTHFIYSIKRDSFILCKESGEAVEVKTMDELLNHIKFPILAKKAFRSKGKGMEKIDSKTALTRFIKNNVKNNPNTKNPYYFEQFKNYSREYRIHCSDLGDYFYTCRKLIRNDVPKDQRWFRNDANCNWVTETHDLFNKPKTFNKIVKDCQKARKALGLDIAGFDVKVDKEGNWTILEANSACSFGRITTWKYATELTKLLIKKESEL